MLRRVLLVAFAVLAALAVIGSTANAATCAGADAVPSPANLEEAHAATLCLLNQERRVHGLAPISDDKRLRRAATEHSQDMVRRGYFDHVGPNGSTPRTRARRAGYITARASYYLAENIGWGVGTLATPGSIVRSWMDSAPHRANILSRSPRDAGVGITLGAPRGGDGATYTLAFGRRGR